METFNLQLIGQKPSDNLDLQRASEAGGGGVLELSP